MFTGIIESNGEVLSAEVLEEGKRLLISTSIPVDELSLGESIAVDGACMTVTVTGRGFFAVDVSAESLRCTTLGFFHPGRRVNLERSLKLGDRLGGHVVSGHVDGIGELKSVRPEGESSIYTFHLGEKLARLLVEKGSVAVDGISLTCFNCGASSFDVAVIPHTLEVTTLGDRRSGDRVNIETDLLGKYVARLIEPAIATSADR
ncbi:MAG: riboflavin synthase [Candidatus Binatia bacterium]